MTSVHLKYKAVVFAQTWGGLTEIQNLTVLLAVMPTKMTCLIFLPTKSMKQMNVCNLYSLSYYCNYSDEMVVLLYQLLEN